jgi:hypothetical protein
MIAFAMPAVIDSADRIAGYPILQQHPVDGEGRVVLVDRGEQYRHRYVVGWQPAYARGWHDGVLLDRFDVALEVFCVRSRAFYTVRRVD